MPSPSGKIRHARSTSGEYAHTIFHFNYTLVPCAVSKIYRHAANLTGIISGTFLIIDFKFFKFATIIRNYDNLLGCVVLVLTLFLFSPYH